MSGFHCTCGFAVNRAEEFGDHMNHAFARDDDVGTDAGLFQDDLTDSVDHVR